RLTNVNRAEPDATLFQVPPGYQVVDETGPFTIEIMRPVHGEPLRHAYPEDRPVRNKRSCAPEHGSRSICRELRDWDYCKRLQCIRAGAIESASRLTWRFAKLAELS